MRCVLFFNTEYVICCCIFLHSLLFCSFFFSLILLSSISLRLVQFTSVLISSLVFFFLVFLFPFMSPVTLVLVFSHVLYLCIVPYSWQRHSLTPRMTWLEKPSSKATKPISLQDVITSNQLNIVAFFKLKSILIVIFPVLFPIQISRKLFVLYLSVHWF